MNKAYNIFKGISERELNALPYNFNYLRLTVTEDKIKNIINEITFSVTAYQTTKFPLVKNHKPISKIINPTYFKDAATTTK